jgi:predicted nucleic acid-binding protein
VTERVFLDSSVLIRYLAEDDPPRALAAAGIIDGGATLVVSGVVLMEAVHGLRTGLGHAKPELARAVIAFLSRENIELVDADRAHVVAALEWSLAASARRIPDAIIPSTAAPARCAWIATFGEAFASPTVTSRLL